RQTWTGEQLPQRIEIAWQPHRQELLLTGIVEVSISGRVGQVLQHVWFASGQAPADVQFRVPETMNDVLVEGGEWNATTRVVTLAKEASKDRPLRLRYSFAISGEQGGAAAAVVFPVPLPVPPGEARCKTTMHSVWETPALVEGGGGPWEELPPEAPADHTRLASLVLRGAQRGTPPVLRLGEAAALATLAV